MIPSSCRTAGALVLAVLMLTGCGSELRSVRISPTDLWSVRMTESFLQRQPEAISYPTDREERWTYEQGVMLEALRQEWSVTHDERYAASIRRNIDRFVGPDGRIRTYQFASFNLDNIPTGRALLFLAEQTGERRYQMAADTLRKQLAEQPRTAEGGFWHKKVYPYQMWLDGLYMAEPFYLRYALRSGDTAALSDIINQFVRIERHTRDDRTGLLYHAWDERHQQRWADSLTGRSPHFWGRAIGWYAMALVDVIELFPANDPRRAELTAILRRLMPAALAVRDPNRLVWYQIMDQRDRNGNYPEASASCMFVYALAKGARLGLLDPSLMNEARASFDGILRQFVTIGTDGSVNLHDVCQGAGLGGDPYRDGSYEYYISEPRRTNDFKGVGPFIMAAIELERAEGTWR